MDSDPDPKRKGPKFLDPDTNPLDLMGLRSLMGLKKYLICQI